MRKRDANKEAAIRQKAIEMIVEHGFDGLSMQKLARAAGVSPATIYIYFKDREDLIVQLFTEVNNNMLGAILDGFSPDMHFEEGMRIQWINRARYSIKNPQEIQFFEQLRHSPLSEKIIPITVKAFREKMGGFVHNAIKRKELMELSFEVFWSIAFAPLYQLVKYHTQGKSYVNKEFILTDEIMDQTLLLILKALKP